MNLKNVEKKEKNTAELLVEVTAAEFDAAINKVYHQTKKNIKVQGFRPGKAPRKIIENLYGAAVFYEDAINEIYPDALTEAVKESGLDMVGYPKVEMQGEPSKDGFTFKATIALRPVATLGTYKGVKADKPAVAVTDEDIQNEMKPLISRATRVVTVDRAIENGDTAVIDFEGFVDGKAFEGGKAEKYSLGVGSGTFIPGFEEQLIGLKTGEEKDINVTFPEEYGVEDLNGKEAVFKIKVHEVKTSVEPELDDEFAKDVSEFDTLKELRESLKQKLTERKEKEAQKAVEVSIMEQIVNDMQVEVPDAMVDFEADKLMEDQARNMQSYGIRLEDYLSMMGMDMATFQAQAKDAALRNIKTELACAEIAKAENIEITDADVDAEITRLANEYDMEEEKIRAVVPMEEIKRELSLTKAAQFAYDNAKITKKRASSKKKTETDEGEESKEEKPKKTTRKSTKKAEGEESKEEKPKKTTSKKSAKSEDEE